MENAHQALRWEDILAIVYLVHNVNIKILISITEKKLCEMLCSTAHTCIRSVVNAEIWYCFGDTVIQNIFTIEPKCPVTSYYSKKLDIMLN